MSIYIEDSEITFMFNEEYEVAEEHKGLSQIGACKVAIESGANRDDIIEIFGLELVEGIEQGLIEYFDDYYIDKTYGRALELAEEYAEKISIVNNKEREFFT